MENNTVQLILDERSLIAITSAVQYTLDKWAGEGFIDQEALFAVRPVLHAGTLEFQFKR